MQPAQKICMWFSELGALKKVLKKLYFISFLHESASAEKLYSLAIPDYLKLFFSKISNVFKLSWAVCRRAKSFCHFAQAEKIPIKKVIPDSFPKFSLFGIQLQLSPTKRKSQNPDAFEARERVKRAALQSSTWVQQGHCASHQGHAKFICVQKRLHWCLKVLLSGRSHYEKCCRRSQSSDF